MSDILDKQDPSHRLICQLANSFRPARIGDAIGRRVVRLDVYQRRAIATVDVADRQTRSVHLHKLDDRECNRVWSHGRAQGKRASRFAQMTWYLLDQIAAGFVHPIEHDQMRASLDIEKAAGKAWIEFDRRLGGALATVLRAIGTGREFGSNAANEEDLRVGPCWEIDCDLTRAGRNGISWFLCFHDRTVPTN